MAKMIDRRDALKLAGTGAWALASGSGVARASVFQEALLKRDAVVGHPDGARVGDEVLAAGGNAVDAIVAAALVTGVAALPSCGIGGYGGHLVIALAGGKKITAIDFNSAAPVAARPDMFAVNEKGQVKNRVNQYGWLASGVPGTLAGLQLALDRYGSRSFHEMVQPAIKLVRDGFPITKGIALGIRASQEAFKKDLGSAKLFLDQGEPLPAGALFKNPDLARMLQTLADRKSVDSFYRGDIAEHIAAAFRKNGGLVTAADLAAYQAREVKPYELTWNSYSIHTAPLTAGGLTILQSLRTLQALGWEKKPVHDVKSSHAGLEALRIAWNDRLRLLGDPDQTPAPVERLLSKTVADQSAARVAQAVKEAKLIPLQSDGRTENGTIHLSAADSGGNLASLTLTHGESFGARVTVDGLGLTLGHGMSRFNPRPNHPNSPGPGKRPLNNMCPTVVLKDGIPTFAIGGHGGRRIPNALFEVLSQLICFDASLEAAVASPRLHTEGDASLTLEPKWPDDDSNYFAKAGYQVRRGGSATVYAVGIDAKTGEVRTAGR